MRLFEKELPDLFEVEVCQGPSPQNELQCRIRKCRDYGLVALVQYGMP